MKTLFILLIPIATFGQIKTKEVQLRKARMLVAATVIPTAVNAGLGMYALTSKDKAIAAIPLVNMVFFFGASAKAIVEKNKIKKL